ncbi:hypothetical protein CPAR01_07472 [Colletotrichum paranaense]|uniref:Uncharacterized protein n=3 Tax=Colletotrichum acutatum species complex TaxID=2707335 RepID=A0AAJ0E1F8_9PEZI|nr:uncharacterized protein CCOS01_07619 [Colletotrichum costaricense]XP_060350615.1 uncharacterized protein CPAR01_07472 [Colletotrichum paranaense]KAI3541077.1 hypothetical protein CSPX01_07735 [Colletotrichum filicis]KAK1451447.1 hypothetical protein CMEL01_06021 [Colletotrichum melonis]KAK1527357.1 hypothetical protein CCOS01_07619 [Colletotrichum costaricense]KAK1541483.1 hypothetical protein CPAR01_07472 [Colletotrichum paranaense]
MAPITPISNTLSALTAGLTKRHPSDFLPPTRTLPSPLRAILASRQVVTTITSTPETTEESASNNNLSGGAIAGIVIGSIAGFLLLLWIVKSCGMWSRPNDWSEKDEYDERSRRYRGRSPGSRHRRRTQHRYHHETSRHSHSRRPSYVVDEVRYTQPVVVDKRRRASGSPLPPANVYRSSRSRTRY